MLLFSAASYNPFFTVLGLLLGAAGVGLGYGGIKLLRSASGTSRVITSFVGLMVLGAGVFVLGLAALCVMWVAG